MNAEDIAVRHLNADLTEKTFWRETMTSLEARVDAFEDLLIEVGL
jgi:oligoendopeptidase F